MSIIIFKPEHFNKVTNFPLDLGMNKFEYEEYVCWMLNLHIKLKKPFTESIPSKFPHKEMVEKGWLKAEEGKYAYTLTRKTLALLWIAYGKQ